MSSDNPAPDDDDFPAEEADVPAMDDQVAAAAAVDEANVANSQEQSEREQVLEQYRAKIREHDRDVKARLKRMRRGCSRSYGSVSKERKR